MVKACSNPYCDPHVSGGAAGAGNSDSLASGNLLLNHQAKTTTMRLTLDQLTQLQEIVRVSLAQLYQNDAELIRRGGME